MSRFEGVRRSLWRRGESGELRCDFVPLTAALFRSSGGSQLDVCKTKNPYLAT